MTTSICAIIKDEQRFLKEWLDYHFAIGFDSIFLCEDRGSLPHQDIVQNYKNVQLIQYFDALDAYGATAGSIRQSNYYNWFLEHNPTNCDYCAFIDIDEFISLNEGVELPDLLNICRNKPGLYLFWLNYNANGNIKRPEGLVRDVYKQTCGLLPCDSNWNYKSIVNMHNTRKMVTVHQVKGGVNTRGFASNSYTTYYMAHIDHYFTKSFEDWIARLKRGDLNEGHRKLEDFTVLNPDLDKRELLAFLES
jgi:hypothetical protein